MLAVLPVANLTGDERQEVLSDGLTEELIGRIGRLDPAAMGVIARTSSMAYKGQRKTVSVIGREQGVDFVLEGSLRWAEERPRVSVQLVRVKDQTPVWAREYQQPLGELSALPDAVALAVALATRLPLSAEIQGRMASRLRVPADAYRAYLEGRYQLASRTREGLESALSSFGKAVALEPSYAAAHAGLADAHNLLQFYGYARGAVGIIHAREAAQRAVALDEGLPEGHAALGYVSFMWLWEWPAAEREFRRAIALDANHAPAHHWYALYLAAMGRPEEARREIELAQRLDPLSLIAGAAAGYVAFHARDFGRAERESRAVLETSPDFMVARAVLGLALVGQGRHAEAAEAFRRAVEQNRGASASYLGDLGHAHGLAGGREEALATLGRLEAWARQGIPVNYGRALVQVGLGDRDGALRSLDAARSQNETAWLWLLVDPRMDPLRAAPGYQDLLKDRPPPHLGTP
jgi:serine/threonine-protein kinase